MSSYRSHHCLWTALCGMETPIDITIELMRSNATEKFQELAYSKKYITAGVADQPKAEPEE